MFHFDLRPEKYEVITGPLEKLLSEAVYQMICFRFCWRIQRILQHIIPRKVIAFLWRHIFHGCVDLSLPLVVLLLLFKAKPSIPARIPLKVHHLVYFLVLILLLMWQLGRNISNSLGPVFHNNLHRMEWCVWGVPSGLTFPLLEPVQMLQVSFPVPFLLICDLRVDQLCLLSVRSAPLVSELMETCIDDVLKAPGVPAATAADEAGPSGAYAAPGATGEDPLSLGGEVLLGSDKPPPKRADTCFFQEESW